MSLLAQGKKLFQYSKKGNGGNGLGSELDVKMCCAALSTKHPQPVDDELLS